MATPLTNTIQLLKENRLARRERRKADTDVILALAKLDTEKEIRFLSTKIEYMDRDKRARDKRLTSKKEKLDELNMGIDYRIGKTETLNPIDRTTGSVTASENIYDLVKSLDKSITKDIEYEKDVDETIKMATIKLKELTNFQQYNQGVGVSDYDKSGIIDKDDVSFESYKAKHKITDVEKLRYLSEYAKNITPDEMALLDANTKYLAGKAAIKTSGLSEDDEVKDFFDNAAAVADIRKWSRYNQYLMNIGIAEANIPHAGTKPYIKANTEFNMEEFGMFEEIYGQSLREPLSKAEEAMKLRIREELGNKDFDWDIGKYKQYLLDTEGDEKGKLNAMFQYIEDVERVGGKVVQAREEAAVGSYNLISNQILDTEENYIQALKENKKARAKQLRFNAYQYYGIDINQKDQMDVLRKYRAEYEANEIDRALSGIDDEASQSGISKEEFYSSVPNEFFTPPEAKDWGERKRSAYNTRADNNEEVVETPVIETEPVKQDSIAASLRKIEESGNDTSVVDSLKNFDDLGLDLVSDNFFASDSQNLDIVRDAIAELHPTDLDFKFMDGSHEVEFTKWLYKHKRNHPLIKALIKYKSDSPEYKREEEKLIKQLNDFGFNAIEGAM